MKLELCYENKMTQNKVELEKLIAFMNAYIEKVFIPLAEIAFDVDLSSPLPDIRDYTPEATMKKQLKVLERSIKRRRKLSAEDLLNIYLWHKERKVSFRRIAKHFKVSEWTIRKTFEKAERILKTADLDFKEGWFPIR